MVVQIKLEPDIFWICTLGIFAGVLLFPILWNKKRIACFSKPQSEINQEFNKRQSVK
jgi:hypothetical protein